MSDLPESVTGARNAATDFLLADLDAAFTFLDVAAVSAIEETKKRSHEHACHAYRTVLHLLDTVKPEPAQRAAINQKLALLKERLEKVGCRV